MKENKKQRRLPSVIRWTLWVLLFQLLLINISAAVYAWRLTHFYADYSPGPAASRNIFQKTWKIFTGPKFPKPVIRETPGFPADTIRLTRSNGQTIEAWYAEPDTTANGAVLLFHGVNANKGYMLEEAQSFLQMGYRVLITDFRAHGNSEGQTTTLGYAETEEVQLADSFMHTRGNVPVFMYGQSMGAVVVAKAVAEGHVQPAAVILDLPFASLQSHLKARARVLGFPQQPFAFLVTGWIGLQQGYNGYRHNTASYTAKIHCPVLVQYGAKDLYVLHKEVEEVYNAIPGTKRQLAVYDHAAHESLLRREPAKWESTVASFLGQYRN